MICYNSSLIAGLFFQRIDEQQVSLTWNVYSFKQQCGHTSRDMVKIKADSETSGGNASDFVIPNRVGRLKSVVELITPNVTGGRKKIFGWSSRMDFLWQYHYSGWQVQGWCAFLVATFLRRMGDESCKTKGCCGGFVKATRSRMNVGEWQSCGRSGYHLGAESKWYLFHAWRLANELLVPVSLDIFRVRRSSVVPCEFEVSTWDLINASYMFWRHRGLWWANIQEITSNGYDGVVSVIILWRFRWHVRDLGEIVPR